MFSASRLKGVSTLVFLQGLNQRVVQVGVDGVRRTDWHDYDSIRRDAARVGASKLSAAAVLLHETHTPTQKTTKTLLLRRSLRISLPEPPRLMRPAQFRIKHTSFPTISIDSAGGVQLETSGNDLIGFREVLAEARVENDPGLWENAKKSEAAVFSVDESILWDLFKSRKQRPEEREKPYSYIGGGGSS